MRKWKEFGDQVNRLVYALAGCKFQTDIECANRFIAERIFYSEVSVRMMRQGRFRPREQKTLEILVEIGKMEAELGRDWASRLLNGGKHANPELVLQSLYPKDVVGNPAPSISTAPYPSPTLVSRLLGGILGSFLTLLLWTYAINPTYPAPHELSLLREVAWGVLVGLGLACGMVFADIGSVKRNWMLMWKGWLRYLVLPASGGLGAFLWNGVVAKLFVHVIDHQIASTGLETFSFGAIYGLAFAIGAVLVRGSGYEIRIRWKPLKTGLMFVIVSGGMSLVGFVLAVMQPAFANQKDVDLFVGILLRLGLIILVAVQFPPTRSYA